MHNQQFTYKIGNFYDCPSGWAWNVDSMHDYDFWLICGGKGTLSLPGETYQLSCGDCFIFKPGARFRAAHRPDSPLQVLAAHFDVVKTHRDELNRDTDKYLYRRLPNTAVTAGLLRLAIQNGQKNRREEADFWMEAALMSFFEVNPEGQENIASGTDLLSGLCAEISNFPNRNWTVASIAKKLKYSGDHSRRLFLRHTGLAPMEYVIHRRVERACFLLKYTDMSLAEIADELNYKTVYYFSRQFSKITGIPPGQYKKKGLGRQEKQV